MPYSSTSDDHRPWSDLPMDLLYQIANCLTTMIDVARFGQVCPTWRAASYTNKHHPSKQFPWLLLAEETRPGYFPTYIYTDSTTGCRGFLILPNEHPDKFPLFPLPAACGKRCVGSGAGWLLMLSIDEDITMASPLTGACVPLPPQSTLKFPEPRYRSENWLDERWKTYITKMVVGKDNSGCYVAAVIAGVHKKLAIARPGDHKWTSLRCRSLPITDVIFHKGKIYAVNKKGTLVTFNATGQAERIAYPPNYRVAMNHKSYIVVSTSDSLFQVVREYGWHELTISITVFELLPDKGRWLLVEDMGDQALFLGFNTSAAVRASVVPGCAANYVYFTDDCIDMYRFDQEYGGGLDSGRYNLKEKRILWTHCAGYSPISPPLWYIPRLPDPSMEGEGK